VGGRARGPRAGRAARAAGRARPRGRRREVIELTGERFSASLPVLEYADPRTVQIGVDIDRETLDRRIAERVEAMFASGFVEEVRHLLDHGLEQGRTAPRAIGYREVIALLRGELDEAEAKERTARATRRFARRQDSWFRKDPRIVWVRYDDPDRLERALSAVGEVGGKTSRVEPGPTAPD
jgi:tRNA dimethylallyltransferase